MMGIFGALLLADAYVVLCGHVAIAMRQEHRKERRQAHAFQGVWVRIQSPPKANWASSGLPWQMNKTAWLVETFDWMQPLTLLVRVRKH